MNKRIISGGYTGRESCKNELAEQFKVCKQTICDIVHYKKYKK